MARTVDVLLTKNVMKLGSMGDMVSVKSGYARNYLFPSASAIPANAAAKRQIEILRERAKEHHAEEHKAAESQKKQLDGMSIQIEANVSHDDQLFGSVGIRDIVDALAKSGVKLDSKQVNLHENIRKLGTFDIKIELVKDVIAKITLEIVNSNPDAAGLDEVLAATADEEPSEEA
ncbi:MAG: 50S ribosomal protein L9 [Planctomycetes bacterium]|nr:50S ribosomal protein L9 [Planctomycetota bacterium]